ncbi:site-specific integrase [Sulfurimonas sp.]|uniref:site-specific integrase n=1 Tax=Sulfurimonas sp. TaxID=2022749 RepID=UPI0019DD84D1|nr:site-specific integrase [Sulfurimonas sp.]MBE0515494.1 site-specific integrase [Sulfurimonas sp.]
MVKNVRNRYLSVSEIRELLKEAKSYPFENVYLCIYLGILTAGRLRTVLNIRKSDIDIENNYIKLDNFKSSRNYRVSISEEASNYFNKILVNYEDNEHIIRPTHFKDRKFPSQAMIEAPEAVFKLMDKLFNQKLNKQNNKERNEVVNFHTLRRSVAINLALSGVEIYKIMTFLNHSSVKQTQDYLNLEYLTARSETDLFLKNIFTDLF